MEATSFIMASFKSSVVPYVGGFNFRFFRMILNVEPYENPLLEATLRTDFWPSASLMMLDTSAIFSVNRCVGHPEFLRCWFSILDFRFHLSIILSMPYLLIVELNFFFNSAAHFFAKKHSASIKPQIYVAAGWDGSSRQAKLATVFSSCMKSVLFSSYAWKLNAKL